MNLSEHLTLEEVCKSNTAIKNGLHNIPGDSHLAALMNLAHKIFEPLRLEIGKPIGISSGYRSIELNKVIGGSQTSQHSKGEAIDIDADIYGGCTNKEIFDFIRYNLEFDQLIWEFGTDINPDWVHVSLKYKGEQRKQILRASRKAGKTVYSVING